MVTRGEGVDGVGGVGGAGVDGGIDGPSCFIISNCKPGLGRLPIAVIMGLRVAIIPTATKGLAIRLGRIKSLPSS